VIAHARPAPAQAVNAPGKKAVNAVLHAGTAAFIAKRQGSGTGQTESVIDLLEQQHTAVTDEVAAIERRLGTSPPTCC